MVPEVNKFVEVFYFIINIFLLTNDAMIQFKLTYKRPISEHQGISNTNIYFILIIRIYLTNHPK